MTKVADWLSSLSGWESGKNNALDYARERMEDIPATHKLEPLTPKQEEECDKLCKLNYFKGGLYYVEEIDSMEG